MVSKDSQGKIQKAHTQEGYFSFSFPEKEQKWTRRSLIHLLWKSALPPHRVSNPCVHAGRACVCSIYALEWSPPSFHLTPALEHSGTLLKLSGNKNKDMSPVKIFEFISSENNSKCPRGPSKPELRREGTGGWETIKKEPECHRNKERLQ